MNKHSIRILILFGGALVGIAALLSTTSVGALAINNSTHRITVVEERVRTDRNVLPTLLGQATQNSNSSENAESCPGRSASRNDRMIRNDLKAGNLIYRTRIEELQPDDWPTGRIYMVDVYGDGIRISRLFFNNKNADDTVVEGVRAYVDLGIEDQNDGPETYSTIVTRLNECS